MLIFTLAILIAAQAPANPTSPVVTQASPAPAQVALAAKPKRKRHSCATGETEIGTRIVMEDCPNLDEYEMLRRAHQAEQAIQFSNH